ncbi:MAG: glutamate mutase L [Candidatus Saccharimonadaceae bacterium]|nr:glutamate mutase L [Candidatus Saccharimonadaceae bacterium]
MNKSARWLISVDIGSTFTKGALFSEEQEQGLILVKRASTPTTEENLSTGFNILLADLRQFLPSGAINPIIEVSSSAKGGLGICAIGIVPDLTLKMARNVAFSAGAKILSVHSYKLSCKDIFDIKAKNPDIILFTGGTDGGNEFHVRHNARALSNLQLDVPIIFAGNQAMRDEVASILENKELVLTENILPEIDKANPEPARNTIREIFLSKIIHGKGLDDIVSITGTLPRPTPLAIFEFFKILPQYDSEWSDFCVVDIGGATTDVYSVSSEASMACDVIFKGLPEQSASRTVEGDLGLRISAETTAEALRNDPNTPYAARTIYAKDIDAYVRKVQTNKEFIAKEEAVQHFDSLLAAVCAKLALVRHCGIKEYVYTASGPVAVQKGKNLSSVSRIIGTGGFLSANKDFNLESLIVEIKENNSKSVLEYLVPDSSDYWIDNEYLAPLAANIFHHNPEAAVKFFISKITKA